MGKHMHPISVKTAGKDFPYSDAMKHSKIVWNGKTLDRFLANPLKTVPGTAMGYAGVTDGKERADLIAYLEQANASPECRKLPPATGARTGVLEPVTK